MLKAMAGLILIFLCLPIVVTGAVIHVPTDQPTIQAGIDVAADGDTVLVADGVYTGVGNTDISFSGKSITVRSENGPEGCTIDCEDGSQPGVTFGWEEGPDAVLEGFTIENSSGPGIQYWGGQATIRGCVIQWNLNSGIAIIQSNPTITGCTITSNMTYGHGGGISCWSSSPIITECTITNNYAFQDYGGFGEGGGIYSTDGTPVIVNNIIASNHADHFGGGISGSQNHFFDVSEGKGSSDAIISGNRITGNYGGGIFWMDSPQVEITNNLIAGNLRNDTAYYYSAGVDIWGSGMIANCTFSDNEGYEVDCSGGLSTITVTDSIIWGSSPVEIRLTSNADLSISFSDVNGGQSSVEVGPGSSLYWGAGMIDVDPLFISGPGGGHYLGQLATGQPADSPCLDSGSGAASATCYTAGVEIVCMGDLSTRTDGLNDIGNVDLGYHYPGLNTIDTSLTCMPLLGTVPFTTAMTATLTNLYTGQIRRIVGNIDVTLASGGYFPNWRAGYTNVAAGDSYITSWNQNIPNIGSVVGDNTFQLLAEDVTPAPYNQPPYPPAGDTDTASCTVTGMAPEQFDYGPPYENWEAEIIGLEMLGADGELLLPVEIYNRIDRDLDLIRTFESALADQMHTPAWVSNQLIIKKVPGEPLTEYDALNAYFQMTEEENLFGDWYVLTFVGNSNIPALAQLYLELAAVEYAEPNGLVGGENYWSPTELLEGTWNWDIDDGWHDCFDGCDCHRHYIFEVDADCTVTLTYYEEWGYPYCEF